MASATLIQRVNAFKAFHNIPKDKQFVYKFGLDQTNKLLVKIGDNVFTLEKNNGSFYALSYLKRMHNTFFVKLLFEFKSPVHVLTPQQYIPPRVERQKKTKKLSIKDIRYFEKYSPYKKKQFTKKEQEFYDKINYLFEPTYSYSLGFVVHWNDDGRIYTTSNHRKSIKLKASDAKFLLDNLSTPTSVIDSDILRDLLKKLDLLDWLDNNGYYVEFMNIEFLTKNQDDNGDFEWSSLPVSLRTSKLVSHWTNSEQLWDSPDFIPNRCMFSAFLGQFKNILESRRITPHPDLTYEGLWRLAKPDQEPPLETEPWNLTLNDAKAWLQKWRIPSTVIDIHNNVIDKYTPERINTNIKHVRFNILMHNRHVWLVNRNTQEFAQKFNTKNETKLYRVDDSSNPSPKWPRPGAKSNNVIFSIDNVDEIMQIYDENCAGYITLITGEEPEDILLELNKVYSFEPGVIVCRNGMIDGFSIEKKTGNKTLTIRIKRNLDGDVVGEQQDDRKKWSQDRYENVMKWIAKLSNEITPKAALSHYSKDLLSFFDVYRRGPRCCQLRPFDFGNAEKGQKSYLCVDVTRAYTAIMRDIDKIPVFSKFDQITTNITKISETNFYTIRVGETDPILFPLQEDFVSGAVLKYAQSLADSPHITIINQIVPHKVALIDPKNVLKNMYECKDTQDCDKKYVGVLAYGLAGRVNNKSSFGTLYQFKDEAYKYGEDRIVVELNSDLFLVINEEKRKLEEGYRPVAHMILNGMRILLHKLVLALGDDAIAVRTDCVYTTLTKEEAMSKLDAFEFNLIKGPRKFEDLGKLRFDMGRPPYGVMIEREIDMPYVPLPPIAEQIYMNDEYDDAEAARILDDPITTPILVVGKYPGTGKSSLALNWAKNKGSSMLVVCPTNALCDNLTKDGFKAITVHTLLGRRPLSSDDATPLVNFKAHDISQYQVIVFEEIFFYPVSQLEWIADFMNRNNDKLFIANGDPSQNAPVKQELNVNFDEYYKFIFRQMFPRWLNLIIPKRYNAQDSTKMQQLYDELLACNSKPYSIAAKYLNVVNWADLKKEDANYEHIAFTNDSVDRVNNWVGQAKGCGYLVPGDEVVGRTYGVVAGKRKINSNAKYIVQQVLEKHLIIVGKDNIERKLTRASAPKLLRRPWCRTGHAIQGQTIGNKLYIHDAQTWMASPRWLRTAITRCRTLDITLITYDDPMRIPKRVIEKRIKNHIQADRKNDRAFKLDANYVTFEWAQQEIKLQNYTCAICQTALDKDWSIDRKDNARAHTKQNCQISCRSCQHASSHR